MGEAVPPVIGETGEGGPFRAERVPPFQPERIQEPRRYPFGENPRHMGEERRTDYGTRPMQGERARVLQNILADPMATAEDKAMARQQLKDMKEKDKTKPKGERK